MVYNATEGNEPPGYYWPTSPKTALIPPTQLYYTIFADF